MHTCTYNISGGDRCEIVGNKYDSYQHKVTHHGSIKGMSKNDFRIEEVNFLLSKDQFPYLIKKTESYLDCDERFKFRCAFSNVSTFEESQHHIHIYDSNEQNEVEVMHNNRAWRYEILTKHSLPNGDIHITPGERFFLKRASEYIHETRPHIERRIFICETKFYSEVEKWRHKRTFT
jgi:hypothetical protein